ncbi:MAG: O-antigen ligase family protein [Pirellulales bacterium]|nr:O-antigen ligase family protein [Pirellulales bacterium]
MPNLHTIAFALSLCMIFVIPWEGVVRFPGLGTGAKLVGFGTAAFWFLAVLGARRFRRPNAIHAVLCLFVLWNGVSVVWSTNPGRSAGHVFTWVQVFFLTCILWDLYTTRAKVLAGLQAYVLGTCVALASALSNFLAGETFYSHFQRYSAGETNPDGFGFIIALAIPVAWYLAVSVRGLPMGRLLGIVNYAFVPMALLGIALSGTRTALIAAVPGMCFGLASLGRLRLSTRIAIAAFVSLAAGLVLTSIQQERAFQRLGSTGTELAEGDLNDRTRLWREGLVSYLEQPVLGVGSNMYRSVNSQHKVAHNSFISVLVELGLVGFALFGAILSIAVLQACSQPRCDRGLWLSLLLVWAIGASTLTWEYRKTTWLFFGLLNASAAMNRRWEVLPTRQPSPAADFLPGVALSRNMAGRSGGPLF